MEVRNGLTVYPPILNFSTKEVLLMTNLEIADFTTRILVSAVTNTSVRWDYKDISCGFEAIFKTIKKLDQQT